jgi:hypothetical protein
MAIWGADGLKCAGTLERTPLEDAHRLLVVLSERRFLGNQSGSESRIRRMEGLPGGAGTRVNLWVNL